MAILKHNRTLYSICILAGGEARTDYNFTTRIFLKVNF